jgi:hypothetical protein
MVYTDSMISTSGRYIIMSFLRIIYETKPSAFQTPVYRLMLDRSGSVEYMGFANVQISGLHSWEISRDMADTAVMMLHHTGFSLFRSVYEVSPRKKKGIVFDDSGLPYTRSAEITVYQMDDMLKRVFWEERARHVPRGLTELERWLIEATGVQEYL